MALRNRYGAVVWLLVLLLLAGVGAYLYNTFKPRPHTSITVLGKDVEVLRAYTAGPDAPLGISDRVITHDAGADLICTDGTRVHLGPLTELLLEQDANGLPRLVLTMGAMRLETAASALGMSIGTPFGVIHVKGAEVTVLDVSVSQGVFVRVGSVSIDHDMTVTVVLQGNQYTIDGLVLPINPNDGVTLQEIVMNLKKDGEPQHKPGTPMALSLYPRQGTRFAPQTLEFKPPVNPQPLTQGDRVETRAGGASIAVESWGRYVLDENAELTITHASEAKRKHEATVGLKLHQGGLSVVAPTRDNATFSTAIDANALKHPLQFKPGLMLTQAHIKKRDDGAFVRLRFGRLVVGDHVVEAGRVAVIQNDEVREDVLSAEHVDITQDMTHVVHYPARVPTINFVWSTTPTTRGQNIEISQDTGFLDVPFAETIKRGSFMVDQLGSNKTYYWRVGDVDAPQHQLQLQSETPDCTDCVPPDVISDTVPHTVIEFDESVTRVDFQWRPFTGASYYLFRMYNDGQFDKPVIVQHANQPNYMLLPPAHLDPGVYYWNAMAYDGEGRLLHKGAMSDFEVQTPESMPPLLLQTPLEAAVVKEDRLVSRGQTRARAKLTCNGAPVKVDEAGRFSHTLPLHQGSNFFVYRVEQNKHMRHIYTRQVFHP